MGALDPWQTRGFLEYFDFPNMEAAVKQESGMTGMMCAVLAGDLDMLKLLAEHRADPNGRASGLADLGYYDTQTLLMVAVKSHQDSCELKRPHGISGCVSIASHL